MIKTARKPVLRVNSVAEVSLLAQRRWHDAQPLPVSNVELISAARLKTPMTGERVSDRWNNNFQQVG